MDTKHIMPCRACVDARDLERGIEQGIRFDHDRTKLMIDVSQRVHLLLYHCTCGQGKETVKELMSDGR